MLTPAVICKQRISHGKEIVQYLQNCKCYKKAILESPYKVPQISQKATIVEGLNFQRLKDAIFKDCSILVYFQRLNCHNFYPILTKVAKLHFFLETTLNVSMHAHNDIRTTSQQEITELGKFEKIYFFTDISLTK